MSRARTGWSPFQCGRRSALPRRPFAEHSSDVRLGLTVVHGLVKNIVITRTTPDTNRPRGTRTLSRLARGTTRRASALPARAVVRARLPLQRGELLRKPSLSFSRPLPQSSTTKMVAPLRFSRTHCDEAAQMREWRRHSACTGVAEHRLGAACIAAQVGVYRRNGSFGAFLAPVASS